MGARRHKRGAALALTLAAAALPAQAGPVRAVSALPEAAALIDIRAEDACTRASLAGARCLPAEHLFDGEGGPVSFHALRWLLGTIGLSGAETVLVFPGDDPRAFAVAGLLHLAGQAETAVFTGHPEMSGRGTPRSFSRERVFVAPMRGTALALSEGPLAPLPARLDDYARGRATSVAFAPGG